VKTLAPTVVKIVVVESAALSSANQHDDLHDRSIRPVFTRPAMRANGHLGIGADADIVVIDPETVSDTATFADPVRPPVGICHVFVGGTPVSSSRTSFTRSGRSPRSSGCLPPRSARRYWTLPRKASS